MQGLLTLSRELHEAADLGEVMDHVLHAVERNTRYQRAWLLLPLAGTKGLSVIGYALADRARVDQRMAELDLSKDAWMRLHLTATEPFVIDDVREAPLADQQQVAYFGNRTLISVPMLRLAEHIGALCVGTFAAEGVLPPTDEEFAFVVQIGALVSVVAGRLRAEAAQRALEEKVRGAQRLEALGRMAGEIAHDFNNMLVTIVINNELAKNAVGAHEAREFLDEIAQGTNRAAGLTRQLLAFSRGQPLEQRAVGVEALVDAFSSLLLTLVPANVALEIAHGAGLPTVYGDAGQIEQVLMNLVVNARDALSTGGTIRIETATTTIDEAAVTENPTARVGEFVVLSVSDTGPGLSPEIAARMFEPFFSTKAPGAGTGLGLAVVDSVVRRHEGFVTVRSEEGRGTTFRVHLPMVRRGQPEIAPAATAPGAAEHPGIHVLVVDDDVQVRTAVQQVLVRAGYRVTAAEDGQAALELLDAHRDVALVITDLVMPRLGGSELVERLSTRPDGPRVLILSGYAPGGPARQTFEHVLAKPFKPDDLVRKVREVVNGAA